MGMAIRQSQQGKTFGMWLGRWRACSGEPGGMKWTSGFPNKLRRVYRYADKETLEEIISEFEKNM